MKISKKLTIQILKYLDKHKNFYFPFMIMCKEHVGDSEFVDVKPKDWKVVKSNRRYQTFELWENLQNLYEDTVQLMAKGFLEKITGESLERRIAALAKNCREYWKEELWESEDIEEFGFNEFIGGKAEAYEECLELVRNNLT